MKSVTVQIRFPVAELGAIDCAAAEAGMTRSEYVRSASLAMSRGNLTVMQALDVIRQALTESR